MSRRSRNDGLVRQVSDMLSSLDDARAELTEKAQDKISELRGNLTEQREVVVPKLQRRFEKQLERQLSVRDAARMELQKRVTGRDDMSIEEWLNKAKVIKLMDKVTFVMSILGMLLTQYVSIRLTDFFGFYFVFVVSVLIAYRAYSYSILKMHRFVYDYCYTINFLAVINVFVQNEQLWHTLFVSANGPVLLAIVAWRNSLVFHDIDKVTSIVVHFFPALLMYTSRWHMGAKSMGDGMTFNSGVLGPIAVYAVWQVGYLIVTEIVEKEVLEADPELITSLRWIVLDKKNSTHQVMKKMGRWSRIMGADEQLTLSGSNAWKSISLFVVLQMAFTFGTFLPTYAMYKFHIVNRLVLVFVGAVACWNGANFTFEVMVKRYEAAVHKRAAKAEEALAREEAGEPPLDEFAETPKKRHSSKRHSSKRGSKRDSGAGARAKGFCATPNEQDRENLAQSLLSEEEPEE